MKQAAVSVAALLIVIVFALLASQRPALDAQQPSSPQYQYIVMSFREEFGTAVIRGPDEIAGTLNSEIQQVMTSLSEREQMLPLPVFLSHLGAQGWRLVSTEDSATTRDYILEREQ